MLNYVDILFADRNPDLDIGLDILDSLVQFSLSSACPIHSFPAIVMM